MAIMINCATDWTYDMFIEDSKKYNATPIKGVRCRRDASSRERFMTWFKNLARDFRAEWENEGRKLYDKTYGYIGDAFARELYEADFSDYYKDTYGQRPHLSWWFYLRAIANMPMDEDITRTFCATPMEDAIATAKRNREQLEREATVI